MSVDEVVLEKDEDASDADSVLDPLPFVARAAEAKERGNEFFKKGENEAAVTAYDAGTAVVAEWNALKAKAKEADAEIQDSDDEEDAAAAATDAALSVEVNDLAVSLHLNKGLALIKLERFVDACAAATAALGIQPENAKALYRRGAARLKLDQLEGAHADFSKALQLDPTNRDAKRELASLRERVKSSRLAEKERLGGALRKASAKGLYGDVEEERRRRKKLEYEAKKAKQLRHLAVNVGRKAKGESELSYVEWDAAEVKKHKADEASKKAAQAHAQKARDEKRRLERLEKGEQADVVVVDDEADLAGCGKGYKTLADGRKTSYFTQVPDAETAALLNATQAPKKLDDSPTLCAQASTGSAWNAAGTTFEERSQTTWVDEALRRHLLLTAAHCCALDARPACRVKVSAVKKLQGEASITVSRGQRRYIFEYSAQVDWEATVVATDSAQKDQVFKGSVQLPELASTVTTAQYEKQFARKRQPTALSPEKNALDRGLDLFAQSIDEQLAAFVAEYQQRILR